MTKTSIEINELIRLNSRKSEFPKEVSIFALSVAYLINDFSETNNITKEEVINSIIETTKII